MRFGRSEEEGEREVIVNGGRRRKEWEEMEESKGKWNMRKQGKELVRET